ncbi:MAG TPA: succinate--CoA ligase subunit alpha [Dehalococcoidia bacterium]|nr:succinate--CoA ligase subunit alpha [Dehalococcoidia bacterium]
MGVLLNEQTRLMIQGMGAAGAREARTSIDFGTNVVVGVTPGRGGQEIEGIPVRDTVAAAVAEFSPNASLIFVPAPFAADAIIEAVSAEIPVVICITEGIPVMDMVRVKRYMRGSDSVLIGPNCPGVITPGAQSRAGIMPVDVYLPGNVGVISRSGTLVYETVDQLTRLGIGQSSSVGVGGDPIIGTTQQQALELFEQDDETAAVVMIGEIGGTAEQEAAEYIKQMSKPVVAFIAGATAPPGRRMGHAGAIIAGRAGTAQAKQTALMDAGATVVQAPSAIGSTMKEVLEAGGLL